MIDTRLHIVVETSDEWQGLLATYTVTNTNDSGAGSLRQAIIDANNNAVPIPLTSTSLVLVHTLSM